MFKFDFDFDENDDNVGSAAAVSSLEASNLGSSAGVTVNSIPTLLEPFCEIPLPNLVCSTFLHS